MSDVAPSVRVGSKWLHNPPSADEFLAWFKATVRIFADLRHEDYVDGIVLISQAEKVKETHVDSNGDYQIVEVERLVYRPYPQVDTRIQYFWDWCGVQDFTGTIEILSPPSQSKNLPAGFSATRLFKGDAPVDFVSAKCRVRAYSGDKVTRSPADATKVVPAYGRYGPDENAMMKAETGAQGRALGFAGMLIIPGAGLSTAEDMQEFAQRDPVVSTLPASTPSLEAAVAEPQDLTQRIATLRGTEPEKFKALDEWAQQREISLSEPDAAHARVLDKRLRDLGA